MTKTVVQIQPTSHYAYKRKRVAAYARVSCGKDTMLHSLAAQIDYYREMILHNPTWSFAGVYADEAKTGTKEDRSEFQSLIAKCRAKEIDMVITKSISRFARNTVTLLKYVRELKSLGIDVYFEEQNIHTLSADGELLLTLLASFAQAESLSVSENCKWRIRKGFEEGKSTSVRLLGYRLLNGEFTIVPEEAETVRYIFNLYLQGYGVQTISNILEAENRSTVNGGRWDPKEIANILDNEKYCGDLLLQKTYISDFLSKKVKKNNGELPQYYVENGHAPIIIPADWDVVQEEIARRKEAGKAYSSATVLSSKLICEDCGGFFGIKVWHSTDKYRRVIYRCNNKYANKAPCRTNHFTEEEVHKMFLRAYNEYMGNRENIIRGAEKMCRVLSDTTDLTRKLEQKTAQRETKAELYRAWISQGAGARSENFKKREEQLYADYDALDKEVNALTQKLAGINNRHTKLVNYIKGLQEKPLILEKWDTAMWITTIRHCIVHRDDSITFVFRDGAKIDIQPAGRTRGIL